MTIRVILAALHLLALGIGLAAVWARAGGLRGDLDVQSLRRVFTADTFWGIAALLWISTGLVRAFSGLEKGSDYYLANGYFLTKMGLLAAILLLEIWPMTTLVRWRIRLAGGKEIDTAPARAMAGISTLQAVLVVAMVFTAVAMARGLG